MLNRGLRAGFYAVALTTMSLAWVGALLAGSREAGVREDLIAEVSPDVPNDEWELIATSDGAQLAWRDKHAGKYLVLLNGKPCGASYDEIVGLKFSKDGSRLSFCARKGKQWFAVVDGAEQPGAAEKAFEILFSPDNSRVAFITKVKGGYSQVVDGKIGPVYKEVTISEFSPDSRHIAYAAQKGKQSVVVEDGVEGPAYDDTGRPRYSPEGQRVVYVARRGKTDFLVVAGKEQPLRESKGGYALAGFAPKTGAPLLVAYDGEASRILIGDVEGPLGPVRLMPVRCADGCRHSVYATARLRNPAFGQERAYGQVVVDGKPGREYEGAPPESAGKAIFRAMGGSQLRIQPGSYSEFEPRLHGVSTPAIAPGFEHVAYAARRGNKDMTVVVDGVEGPPMDAVPCDPQYGPDGKLYYVGVRNGKAMLLADGKTAIELPLSTPEWDDKGACFGPDFAGSGHYVFGIVQKDGARFVADGSVFPLRVMLSLSGPKTQVEGSRFHFAYTARPEPSKPETLLVVDGKEGRIYNDIWPATVRWVQDGVLTYIARQGQKLLRVTQTLP